MNHTFSTVEDDRYEGDETYEAGYSFAGGGHDIDYHEYCPVTIVDDDDPKVDSAWFNSTPADGHTYRTGEWIEVAAKFNGRAAVDGDIYLGFEFRSSRGFQYREADYRRGSGTNTLVFGYQVDVRDRSVDYEVQPNSILLRGGTLYGVWSNGTHHREDTANRAIPNGYGEELSVDGRPYVRSVSVTSRPRVGDTYGRGEKVEVQVTFDQEVVVSGEPVLGLTVGGAWRGAGYTSGSGTRVLTLHYEVGEDHTDTDGISIRASNSAGSHGFVGIGSSIADDEFDVAANRAYSAQRNLSGHKVDGSIKRAPSEPTGLTAGPATPTMVPLSWTAPEHQGATAVAGYKVEWSADGNDPWMVAEADTASTSTSYTHTGRAPQTTYHYRVSAINSVGASEASASVSATTPALPVVTISASVDTEGNPVTAVTEGNDARFTLSFTGNVTEVSRVDAGLEVQGDFFAGSEATFYWSDPPAGQLEGHIVTTTSADALDEADGWVTVTLLPEDEYTIGRPKTATVTILDDDDVPGAIGDLAAAPGDERVVLSWSPPMDEGTSPVLGFDYRARKETASNWSSWTDTGVGPRTSNPAYTVTNLDNGTPYTFEVRARSAAGKGPPSNRATGTPLPPPVLTSIELTSDAGSDDTYAIGDDIVATVTFDRTLRLDTDNGTPALTLTIGNGTGEATCALATDTRKLDCTYTVVGDEEDTDGVSVGADPLALNGGRIHGIHGATGGDAELTHAALGSDPSHKVDGVRPTPTNASVNGIALTLEWSEPLDTGSAPAAGQFALAVDSGTAPAVSSLTMSGTTMTLTLASAADATRDYTLAYTVPSSNPVKDLAGNEAVAFTGRGIETVQITWSFTLTSPRTDGAGNALVVEGGATATATVSISNAVTTTVAQKVKLQWGGTDIGGDSEPGRLLTIAGVVGPTITVPAGDSSASAVIGVREDALYAPTQTATLTAIHLGTQIGSAELTLTDDDAPPVMTIAVSASSSASDTRMSAITIDEGGGFHLELTLDRGFATFQDGFGSAIESTAPSGTFNAGDLASLLPSFARGVRTFGTGINSTDNTTAGGAVDAAFAIASDADGRYTVGTPMSATVRILDDDDVPTVPRNLTAKEGDREVALRWKLPRSYNNIEITGYQYRARGRGGAWRPDWTRVPDSEATTRSYTVTGLTNATAYTFEVRAVNDAGAGPQASVTATPRDHGLFVGPTTIGEGGSATVIIIPQEAPFDTAETVTMVLASAQGPDQPRETSDFRVTTADDEPLAGTDRPFTVPGRTGRHPHPHYAVAFAPADSEAMVKVGAVDDDISECREEILVYAYTDYGTAAEKRISTRPPTVAHSIFLEDDDRQATLESATIDGATATLTFDRAVALVTEPDDPGDPGYKPNPPHHYFTLFTGARPGENAVGTLATGFSLSGRTATVTFPEAVERGVTAWVRYDRFGRWAPLGKPTAGRCGQAVPTATWALGESSGGGTDNLPTLSIADGEGTEGTDATVDFTVTRTGTPTGVITVSYATRGGSALADNDFVSTSGSLAFGTGESTKTISVPIIDDTHEDDVETFTVTLSNPVNATIADGTATGTIHNTEDPREPSDALTASFSDVPATHDGSAFTFGLTFSEAPDVGYAVLRDDAFTVSGGSVETAQRRAPPSNLEWNITVEPTGTGDVTVELSTTSDCAASDAICTADETPLTGVPAAFTVAGPTPPEPLTATFTDVPSEHRGEGETFTFGLTFSEEFGLSYKTLRDEAFSASGGEVRRTKRKQQGSNQSWTIHVEPAGHGPVTVTLPETTDCGASGAICTGDDRPLSHSLSATVAGPVGISVGDARVEEDDGAVLSFAVTLSRAASGALTVDYATSDGSAQAGVDYTAASGTLTFQAGESSRTIEVTVLDDSHDDDGETLMLTLSNPSSGRLTDAEATGTIENRDPLPRALLARFGRTAAVHVVEHVEERLQAPRQPGFRGRVAGRELRRGMERELALSFLGQLGGSAGANGNGVGGHDPMAGSPGAGLGGMGSLGTLGSLGMRGLARGGAGMPGAAGAVGAGVPMLGAGTGAMGGAGMMGGAPGPTSAAAGPDRGLFGGGLHSMGLGGDNLLTGSAFAMNRESHGGILSFWSRGARSHFSGREGTLSLGGDVRTTMFGADYAKGPLVAGLSLLHSRGLGEYAGVAAGQVASAVTGLYPWVGYKATDRVTVWGVAGYGRGGLLLTADSGSALGSGLSMAMAAAGTRGELIAGGAGGVALAFKADALWVGTAIDGVDGPAGRLKATDAAVTRFRTGLEGSRAYTPGGRLSLRPSVEVGLRHDGGDAETGAGMDVGAELIVSDASTGLAVDVRVRTLLVHQAEGFRERGMALSLSYTPTPSTPLGLTAKVAPSWGGQAQSGAEALWGRETMAGMGQGGLASGNRLEGEVGYGLPVGGRFVGTPRVGFSASEHGRDYRVGYGLGVLEQGNVNFELRVDAQRRESPMEGGASNGLLGRATLGW